MEQAISYSFQDRLVMSQGVSESATVQAVLLNNIPGAANVYRASRNNDRNGTDWWVEHENGNHLSIDAKVRGEDWAAKGRDDLALETWSVIESKKVGWTRNPQKRTDYILWLWTDTGRWCLVPFPMLCAVFSESWQEWIRLYKVSRQHTPEGNYHSECVFVPRKELWAAIYRKYSGIPVNY